MTNDLLDLKFRELDVNEATKINGGGTFDIDWNMAMNNVDWGYVNRYSRIGQWIGKTFFNTSKGSIAGRVIPRGVVGRY